MMRDAHDGDVVQKTPKKKRVIDKDRHRIKLMEATARVIAKYGIAGATIDRIHAESQLSRGMINLHFKSKENLYLELVKHMGQAYVAHWQSAIADRSLPAIDRLRALISSDFAPEVMNEVDSAVWIAFRAETRIRDEIRAFVGTRDKMFGDAILNCFRELARTEPCLVPPDIAAEALTNLLEGFLLDYTMNQSDFDRARAVTVCMGLVYACIGRKASDTGA